jgi:integrase
MRRSEVLGLRWLDIDRKGERIILPQSKNGDGRIAWLNALACQILDSLRADVPTSRVFPASNTVTPENVSLAFLRTCRRVGIADFRLHDLRHTAASWLRMSGADLQDVAELLGHRDLRMTKRYAHLSPAHLSVAVRRLDGVFGQAALNGAISTEESDHDEVTIEFENHNESVQIRANGELPATTQFSRNYARASEPV